MFPMYHSSHGYPHFRWCLKIPNYPKILRFPMFHGILLNRMYHLNPKSLHQKFRMNLASLMFQKSRGYPHYQKSRWFHLILPQMFQRFLLFLMFRYFPPSRLCLKNLPLP